MSDKTPEQICSEAADYIMEHGWTQGLLKDANGHVCAMGAINMASFGGVVGQWGDVEPLLAPRMEAIQMVIIAIADVSGEGMGIAAWNDRSTTTQEDVLLILKKVAAGEYNSDQG